MVVLLVMTGCRLFHILVVLGKKDVRNKRCCIVLYCIVLYSLYCIVLYCKCCLFVVLSVPLEDSTINREHIIGGISKTPWI